MRHPSPEPPHNLPVARDDLAEVKRIDQALNKHARTFRWGKFEFTDEHLKELRGIIEADTGKILQWSDEELRIEAHKLLHAVAVCIYGDVDEPRTDCPQEELKGV